MNQEIKRTVQKRKVSDIIFKEDVYARFEPDQRLISSYEENIEPIIAETKIQISINNILIDGYHRLKAIERVYGKDYEMECIVHETDNTDYIELESYAANEKHGKKNSKAETVRNIQRLYAKGHNQETIMSKLSIAKSIFFNATTKQRKSEKDERDKKVIELYLRAWNTQQGIADVLRITKQTVSNIIDLSNNSTHGVFGQNFTPLLYNIWNVNKQDNERKHFGAFPEIFMQNLIHYHTDPMDIIFDPFGGGGTTIDVCKQMVRRYYVSDRKVIPGREKDIKEHDIVNGLPDDLQKPKLVFLDPPYWKQAEGKYSEDAEDLGNMALNEFNSSMENLFSEISKRKIDKIAVVIQPTQYSNDFKWQDHIFDFDKMLPGYKIVMRYI